MKSSYCTVQSSFGDVWGSGIKLVNIIIIIDYQSLSSFLGCTTVGDFDDCVGGGDSEVCSCKCHNSKSAEKCLKCTKDKAIIARYCKSTRHMSE